MSEVRRGIYAALTLVAFLGCSLENTARDEDNGCYVLAEALGTRFCCDWGQNDRTGYLVPRAGGRGCWITECIERDDGGECQIWSDRWAWDLLVYLADCERSQQSYLDADPFDRERMEEVTRECFSKLSAKQRDHFVRRSPFSVLEGLPADIAAGEAAATQSEEGAQ